MAKIAVIASYPPSLINFRGPLLEAMIARGHEVVACAPPPPAHIRRLVEKMRVGYEEYPLQRTALSPPGDLKSFLFLCKLLKKMQPQVVLSYTIKPVIYGSLAAQACGAPRIFSMVEGLGRAFNVDAISSKDRLLQNLILTLYKLAVRCNEGVFFLNPHDEEFFLTRGILASKTKSVLLDGIGVDLNHFSPKPLPEACSFLMIARLIREKGVCEFAEAAKRIRTMHPQCRFYLAGRTEHHHGSINRELIASWEDRGLIDYLGELKDVRRAIGDSSVLVLPSYYREGLPRVILEAMAMGRPVITTNTPGCRDAVKDGISGLLVPVKDVSALSEAMRSFIEEPYLIARMGSAGRAIAVSRYDVHRINRIVLDNMGL